MTLRTLPAVVLGCALATGCTQQDPTNQPADPVRVSAFSNGQGPLPANVEILTGKEGLALLQQCSRGTPLPGEDTWEPPSGAIRELESALPAALRASPPDGFDPETWQARWHRSYVGLVRGGKRYVYGDFAPGSTSGATVCDGGTAYFGVEYDIDRHRFTHLAFNGYG